jgi:ectoine hydroxylase-related dioxygenase (phytanoyl-CoA dioxygenase family)
VKDATAAAGMGSGPPGLFSQTDFIREDDAFLELVDWHRVFPKIWGILGWNIYLYHAHCDVTPPVPVAAGAEDSRQRSYRAWHQDSMRVNEEIEIHPRPRLSVKVAYFLTDTTVPGCGNMWVYPGSQRMDELHVPDGAVDPPGAVPVVGKPGTAIIFDRRIWHSRSLNTSAIARKGVFFGYSYRWLQPKDDMNVRQLYTRLDPIRRQILGDALCADGRYAPQDGDVPLRGWLREHGRLDSAGMTLREIAGAARPPR